jgi:hypothetical protein
VLLAGDGHGGFKSQTNYIVGPGAGFGLFAADFDGNGTPDIVDLTDYQFVEWDKLVVFLNNIK